MTPGGAMAVLRRLLDRVPSWVAWALPCVLLVAYGAAILAGRPDLLRSENSLYSDPAHYLLVSKAISEGRMLYSEMFFHYGPVSAGTVHAFAVLLGNTPEAHAVHNLAFTLLLGLVLAACLPRSRPLLGAAVLVVVLFALAGRFWLTVPYRPVENFLAVLVLALRFLPLPTLGTRPRLVLAGVALGLLHATRFGAGAALALLFVAVDLVDVARRLIAGGDLRAVARTLPGLPCVTVGLASVAVVAAEAAILLASVPRAHAMDAILPLYHLEWFASYVTPAIRWPAMPEWGPASLGFVALAALALASLAVVGFRAARGDEDAGGDAGSARAALVAGCVLGYFVLNCFLTWKHGWAISQRFWMLLVPLVLLPRLPRGLVVVPGLVVLAAAAWAAREGAAHALRPISPGTPRVELPGGHLYLAPAHAAEVLATAQAIEALGRDGRRPVLLTYSGFAYGCAFWLDYRPLGRHTFHAPGVWRPHEFGQQGSLLAREGAGVLVVNKWGGAAAIREEFDASGLLGRLVAASGEPVALGEPDPATATSRFLLLPVARP